MFRNRDNVSTRRGWPQTGRLAHLRFHCDEHLRGGCARGEVAGMAPAEMRQLLAKAAFEPVERPFQLGFDRIHVAKRP